MAARYASRPSSSPETISISTPQRAFTAATSSAPFGAMRSPAVPAAAIASAPFRRASSAMSAIASTVRSIGFGFSRPDCSRPSPSRVISTRSTIARQPPSARRSPTWSLTEFVPTSITAYRCANPTSAFSPRGKLVFGRDASPSSRTVASTRAASADSTAIVRVVAPPARTSVDSAMQPSRV